MDSQRSLTDNTKSDLMNSNSDINNLLSMPSEFEEDDVMKELEDFVKPKRKTGKNVEGEDVYEMCD